jgi:hypothetical protein
MFSGETYKYRMTKIVIAAPFNGEKDVFKLRASQSTFNPPRAQVRERDLRLTWTGDAQASADAAAIRRSLEGELEKIEQHLSWSRGDIDMYNASIRTLASSAVTERKAKLLADRQLEAGLSFPVRQRADASQYSIPVTRRKIDKPRPAAAKGLFQPEPVLPDAQYEQALAVLRNARTALERTGES